MKLMDAPGLREALYPAEQELRRRAAKHIKAGDFERAEQLLGGLRLLDAIDTKAAEVAAVLAPTPPYIPTVDWGRILVSEDGKR